MSKTKSYLMSEKKKSKKHYVDNEKLFNELSKYRKQYDTYITMKKMGATDLEKPRVSEYVGLCILEIANRLSTRPNFSGYPFREEMVADAYENCIKYIHNFDPNKSRYPFSYLSQNVYFTFLRHIKKEKKILEGKMKLENQINIYGETHDQLEGDEGKYSNDIRHSFGTQLYIDDYLEESY